MISIAGLWQAEILNKILFQFPLLSKPTSKIESCVFNLKRLSVLFDVLHGSKTCYFLIGIREHWKLKKCKQKCDILISRCCSNKGLAKHLNISSRRVNGIIERASIGI